MESVSSMLGELTPCGGGDPIPLLGQKLLVGRRSSCDICLRFSNVSSHHCELAMKSGYWHVRDLGSSNGIKVNGEKCQTRCLMPGDVLQIAKHQFRIDYSVSSSAPPPEEEENPLSMSLMEKAGLSSSSSSREKREGPSRASRRVARGQRASSEDEFIMEWLSDE
jgi:pSer/pThr/pTyr-binding forkhead associated (FHA) protein